MFTLGGTELLLIGVLALLLFGPDKIPQLARTLGRAMREFNKYKDIMESAFRVEMQAAEKAADPDMAGDDSMERLEKSAAASREFADEHGAVALDAEGTDGETGSAAATAEDTPAVESAPCPEPSLIATDEDEEEG